jgi:hypothetical protein
LARVFPRGSSGVAANDRRAHVENGGDGGGVRGGQPSARLRTMAGNGAAALGRKGGGTAARAGKKTTNVPQS